MYQYPISTYDKTWLFYSYTLMWFDIIQFAEMSTHAYSCGWEDWPQTFRQFNKIMLILFQRSRSLSGFGLIKCDLITFMQVYAVRQVIVSIRVTWPVATHFLIKLNIFILEKRLKSFQLRIWLPFQTLKTIGSFVLILNEI